MTLSGWPAVGAGDHTLMARRSLFGQIQRAIIEAERAERRHQRELLARARHAERMERARDREAQRLQAELEAETFKNQVDLLLSIHHQASPTIEWATLAAAAPPAPPVVAPMTPVDSSPIDRARHALDNYTPGFLARLFRREERKRASLWAAVDAAIAAVARAQTNAEDEYQQRRAAAQSAHDDATAEWQEQVSLSKAVLSGDATAYDRVIAETGCLQELQERGCTWSIAWPSATLSRIAIRTREVDVVPVEEKSVSARGTLSVKKLAAGRIAEIYQDFLCGVALRAARELLAVLPLRGVLVDVWTQLLSVTTGQLEDATVLSAYFPRGALDRVNFERVDPSELVRSLKHSMKFTRAKGMIAVEPLDAAPILAGQDT